MPDLTRRDFLRLSGASAVSLGLSQLAGAVSEPFVTNALAQGVQYASWEDLYRKQWSWDKAAFGCHGNACLPGQCSWRVYLKGGRVWREEQVAEEPASGPAYPDYNPLGCQKGAGWSTFVNGEERLRYPLKRIGERGEGKWRRIGWDEALTEIADAIIDAIEKHGSETFVLDAPHLHAGSAATAAVQRLNRVLGGVCPDLNVQIGDLFMGLLETFGKNFFGFTPDNLFDAQMIIFTCANPSHTHIPIAHFHTEARYNGAEIVVVAPDFSPSTVQADIHIAVKVGTDTAFWLGVCQVIVAEGLHDAAFIKEQTDLPLLVRTDTRKFLRERDLVAGGKESQLYYRDSRTGAIAKASRKTLRLEGDPVLDGTYKVRLKDGKEVEVTPAFAILKERLNREHAPEKASARSNVPPSAIRSIARKMAAKRTCTFMGFTSAKSYHGDLAERCLLLAHALTGNMGKPGTGYQAWSMPSEHWEMLLVMDKPVREGGLEDVGRRQQAIAQKVLAEDPDATDEMITLEMNKALAPELGIIPPVFYQYYHVGYKELWDKWQGDPALGKPFSAYLEEAIAKGWWTEERHIGIAPDKHPQVVMNMCHNFLRRERSGFDQYRNHLLPKLKLLFTLDVRVSGAGLYSDVVLPCALSYEKEDLSWGFLANPRVAFMDRAADPPGEAKPEWEICWMILEKVGERAKERGLTSYRDKLGKETKYGELYDRFTMNGYLKTHKDVVTEMIAIGAAVGMFPKGASYEQAQREGAFALQSYAKGGFWELTQANEYSSNKPCYPLRWHVENKKPYPTFARRAQFYIDHDWFLQAGEELPTFKEVPPIGGQHPLRITGGHPRHSTHTMQQTDIKISSLHRAQPVVHINNDVAKRLGIRDGERVRVYNDVSEVTMMARVTPAVAPDQVIVYLWDPLLFDGGKPYDNMLVGLPKALQLAGGYEHIGRYYMYCGSPPPTNDRGVRVSVQRL